MGDIEEQVSENTDAVKRALGMPQDMHADLPGIGIRTLAVSF
jgi:hypothetical protein